jgi:hypothetical protein
MAKASGIPKSLLKYSDPERQRQLQLERNRVWLLKPENKEKNRQASLRYRRRNRHLWHSDQIKYRYGMTPEQYAAQLAKQQGLCAICRQLWPERLHVDHNHLTNANRGLLCGHCNRGIGLFKENVDALAAAIRYLHEWGL